MAQGSPLNHLPWNVKAVFLFISRTYFAMAVKAKSTLRPVFALVSMKGSPYSCKQLLPTGCWAHGGNPSATIQEHPHHPVLTHLG